MNPNSPEDRLLDELLHEQSHAPDEAFLKQIEVAVDAGPIRAAKRSTPSHYGRLLAVAASIALAAGIWALNRKSPMESKSSQTVISETSVKPERTEIASDPMAKKQLAANHKELINRRLMAEAPRVSQSIPESDVRFPEMAANDEASTGGNTMSGGLGGSGTGNGTGFGVGMGSGNSDQSELRQPRPRIVPPPGDAVIAGKAKSILLGRDSAPRRDVAPEEPTGDRYGKFIDQPWKSPEQDPLSTFSIDVDTASYSNVRRMIQEGREVPKDAVRIEEFINAFKYQYAAPKGDGPFAVSAALAVCPWAPTHQLVRVAIKGREIETNKRPASNLVFLIDVSGSMQSPDKLPLLRQSMATLVAQLDERDRVAIVVYAGTEGVALPSTRLDAEGRATVLKALGKLEAGGSTNGGAGIKRAYELAMKQKIEGGVNRVILATDGDFNVGVTGQQSLVELVKDRAKDGVYLTVLGFGTGNLNDAMMDAITRDGNGNYFYIDSEREGRKVFLQNLSGTLVTIAKDVKIQVEFNPAKVGSYRLIGYSNRVLRNEDFSNDKVDAGDIGAGHTVTAFYELTPRGAADLKYQTTTSPSAASDEWLTVKLRHKHPDGDESRLIEFPLTGEVVPLNQTDTDYQFATAAALFGMKLRGMEEVKDIAWEKVLDLARPGLANDAKEDRAEFVELVKKLGGTDTPAEDRNGWIIHHEDGSRTVFSLSPDRDKLFGKTFSPDGALVMIAIYRLDSTGSPYGCKILDAQNQELFRISYGYLKTTGLIVEEQMFDSRVKRMDPDTGKEIPVQRVVYPYDASGKRGAAIVLNRVPGKTFEQVLGSAPGTYPFEIAELLVGDWKSKSRPRAVPAPAEHQMLLPPLPIK